MELTHENEMMENEMTTPAEDAQPAESAENVGAPMGGLSPEELAEELAAMLDNKKAFDIKILNLKGKSDICDYFVLATGTSNTHVRSLAGELEYKCGLRGVPPFHVEGRGGNTWMVLDFTSVMVHIFTRETREFYHLDRLYRDDAPKSEN